MRRTVREDRRHMSRAAVVQRLGVHVGDCDEHGGAERIWNEFGHRVEVFEHFGRFGPGEQQCTRRSAKLTHHGRGGQAAADAVPDDDADLVVADGKHVVEVAADLQRTYRGLVPHRAADGQRARREKGTLQRQGRLARDLELPHVLHRETDVPEQRHHKLTVLGADRTRDAMLQTHDDITRARKHGNEAARRACTGGGTERGDGQRQPVTGVVEGAAPILVEIKPTRHGWLAGRVDCGI